MDSTFTSNSKTSTVDISKVSGTANYTWPVPRFLSKFSDWKFCPPSDHLWTIKFLLSSRKDNKGNSIENLYSNICTVNNRFKSIYGAKWDLKAPSNAATFITKTQDSEIGVFLANSVSFNTNAININASPNGQNSNHTGFLSYGKTLVGRQHDHNINIRFLRSNWDIHELFFDKWIAAIGQQGLIESEDLPNIKATIIIQEYACSVPGGTAGVWFPKKQITLYKAFPYKRDDKVYNYEPNKAGSFEDAIVNFQSDSYQIEYLNLPSN